MYFSTCSPTKTPAVVFLFDFWRVFIPRIQVEAHMMENDVFKGILWIST
jgi:hypothetical protein